MNKVYYTYEDMVFDIGLINKQLARDSWKPDVILGIARGGLIPAVYFSHWWDVPLETCHVSLRDHQRRNLPSSIHGYLNNNKNVLIVDDICDGGETLEYVSQYYLSNTGDGFELPAETARIKSLMKTAVLIHNEGQKVFDPDYAGRAINKVNNPSWIVYPWEV